MFTLWLILTGGCENVILSGLGKDVSIWYQNTGEMNSVTCNEEKFIRHLSEPITNLKSHIHGKKYIWKLTPTGLQPYSIYKTSKSKFMITVSFDTPLSFNSPALSFLFMQTEPYSWVDIAVYLKPASHTNIPFLKQAYLSGSIHLSDDSNINSNLLGSVLDDMCVINFDARKSMKENVQFTISMKTRFMDVHTDLISGALRFPLRSTFNATHNFSKLSPNFILKMQGYPIELTISNAEDNSTVMNMFWLYNNDETPSVLHDHLLRCGISTSQCNICIPSKVNTSAGSSGVSETYYLKLYELPTCKNSACPVNKDVESIYRDHLPYRYQDNLFSKSKCVRCLKSSCIYLHFEKQKIDYSVFDYDFIEPYSGCNIPYETKKSWIEASMLCRSAGGYLPIIRSRKQLNELMDIIKLMVFLPPIHLIFIGLIIKNQVIYQSQ